MNPSNVLSYAIFSDFAQDNTVMAGGINRRIFQLNTGSDLGVVTERGDKIALRERGGVIVLQPGIYHITGFSMVSMQWGTTPVVAANCYPGYCLVYDEENEADARDKNLCVGSWALSSGSYPSHFDFGLQCDTKRRICVGHQSGNNLPVGEAGAEGLVLIYTGINAEGHDAQGNPITSTQRLFARIAIFEM